MLIEAYLAEAGRDRTLSADQARGLVASNLCRCTGYQGIVEAVLATAQARQSRNAGDAGAAGDAT
jgi:carbon-monoxide dehydrogenase small subunit